MKKITENQKASEGVNRIRKYEENRMEHKENIDKERNERFAAIIVSLEEVGLGFVEKKSLEKLSQWGLEEIAAGLGYIDTDMDELFGHWGNHEGYSDDPKEYTERLQELIDNISVELMSIKNVLGVKHSWQEDALKVWIADKEKIENQIQKTNHAIDEPTFPATNCGVCGSKNIHREIEQVGGDRLSQCVCLGCENSWPEEPEVSIKTLRNRRARLMRKVKKLNKDIQWAEKPTFRYRERVS